MKNKGKRGVLLHPTALPSPYGIGDLGGEAYRFVDFLAAGKQSYWQILPLNPPGLGNSPYQCYSAFAGNPLLIAAEFLHQDGLLTKADLYQKPLFPENQVDFSLAAAYKNSLLKKAYLRFTKLHREDGEFQEFIRANSFWLEDYALFMALKSHFGDRPWHEWDGAYAFRNKKTLAEFSRMHLDEINYHKFVQYLFFSQWGRLKEYAHSREIAIIGDLPIFVAGDSADLWTYPELFDIDEKGVPVKSAGVPPDYFSSKGQLWGNPLYRWDVMKKDGYLWWKNRFRVMLHLVDLVRIDHFRGFEAYWAIPAGEETAINGQWVPGPGRDFFAAIEKDLGPLPAIAEDLGFITPEVEALKKAFAYPGIKVLQFTLGSGEEKYFSPDAYEEHCAVYTGTHDNTTILGWFNQVIYDNPQVAALLKKHFKLDHASSKKKICWRLIEFAYQTAAHITVIPLQDLLCLGDNARMNYPGTESGNWGWRYLPTCLTRQLEKKLAELTVKYQE